MPPFRPIVSGCGSCCEKISNFVDYYLKPLARENNSYIKDTTDFIRKIEGIECAGNAVLVSADVSGLYTVINHEEGVEACGKMLDGRGEDEKRRMPTVFIKRLVALILKSNCFSFLGKFYHQQTGTAMGTPMAPGYANIFMGVVEKELLRKYEEVTGLKPKIWLRFLDDIFMVWEHGEEELSKFIDFMQSFGEKEGMRTDLKFTFEQGKSVAFLDTMVSLEGDKLKTDLYSKPTDAHLYLRQNSCHPKSCTKGLVKGELLRARRICTKKEDFEKSAQRMMGFFVERGFKKSEVLNTYKEVLATDREEALQYRKKESTERVPFVITFHPRLRKLGTVLNRYFYLLQSNERLKKAFPQAPMVAFRRLRNLKDMLVHSGSQKEDCTQTVSKCGNIRCKCCSHLEEKIDFNINGKQHELRGGGSCKTSNLIYGVRCKLCGLWYVGESGMKLHERLNQHCYSTN